MQEDSCKRTTRRRRKRERVGAQAVYIDTSLLSQREPKMAPSLFKRVHEIEKMESDNGKRQCSRVKRALAGLRFSGQVREGLKRREIFGKYTA
jgi:hypothetical protein